MSELDGAELDLARAKEAHARREDVNKEEWSKLGPDYVAGMVTAARLAREGWVPVDPDLIEARQVAEALAGELRWGEVSQRAIRAGKSDGYWIVRSSLAAIKRGRELERAADFRANVK